MSATLQELIKKGFHVHNKTVSSTLKQKIEVIANHFGNLETFLNATKEDFESIKFVGGESAIKLSENEYAKIKSFQNSGLVNPQKNISHNFVNILTTDFISRQLAMIDSLKLETLNVNPILAGALNLNNEKDLLRYYIYQAISRSIVTSVGFLVQDLLLYASEFVTEGKNDELGEQTKWDLVVEKFDEVKAYLEIKSGTNDMNKSQIHHYSHEIEMIEKKGHLAFIGETYGKRTDKTITHGLLKQYLPDWEKRTLIGKELWIFVSDDKNYHEKLIEMLMDTSKRILANETIMDKIEKQIQPMIADFQSKYKSYKQFLKSLW